MSEVLYLKTGKFEHQNVREDFINPISFGEDFAKWLTNSIKPLTKEGFTFSEPIMEDYGHGIEITNGDDKFWIALSFAEEGPTENEAHWVITVAKNSNFLKRLFKRENTNNFEKLKKSVFSLIESEPEIKVFTEKEWLTLAET